MIEIRPYEKLGHANHGWLNATHHFSFSNYYDPSRLGWGQLRVWNDDTIAPKMGFPLHPHQDMEIITYVYQGAITHKDSLGNEGKTVAGDVQVMSAGSGIIHSEYNLEEGIETRLFQIWIMPTKKNLSPSWGSKPFPKADRSGEFVCLASGDDNDTNALRIQANASVSAVNLQPTESVSYTLQTNRLAYLVSAKGKYRVNGLDVNAHDGVAIKEEEQITITAIDACDIVLVEIS